MNVGHLQALFPGPLVCQNKAPPSITYTTLYKGEGGPGYRLAGHFVPWPGGGGGGGGGVIVNMQGYMYTVDISS